MNPTALKFFVLSASFAAVMFTPIAAAEGSTRETHIITSDGVRLWYHVAGRHDSASVPMLFLHGGPGYNSYSFEHSIGRRLEQTVEMIYFDERGSGRSQRSPNNDYSMGTLVNDIETLRKHLGVPKLLIMGHSFGGTLALEYASRFPQHVERLIVLDGVIDMPYTLDLWRHELQTRYPVAWSTAVKDVGGFGKSATGLPETCPMAKVTMQIIDDAMSHIDGLAFRHWQQFHQPIYQKQQSRLDRQSGLTNTGEFEQAYFAPGSQFACYRFTDFNRVAMPTLVMVGSYDRSVGVNQMRELAARLPDGYLDVFPNSGHFVYLEESNKFVDDISMFLRLPSRDGETLCKRKNSAE